MSVFCRPIHDAVESGNLEVVKLLVEYDVEVAPDSGEQLPIAIARKKGFREIEKYLEGECNPLCSVPRDIYVLTSHLYTLHSDGCRRGTGKESGE